MGREGGVEVGKSLKIMKFSTISREYQLDLKTRVVPDIRFHFRISGFISEYPVSFPVYPVLFARYPVSFPGYPVSFPGYSISFPGYRVAVYTKM